VCCRIGCRKEHLADGDVIESSANSPPANCRCRHTYAAGRQAGNHGDPLCGASDKSDPDKLTLTRSIAATPALGEQQYEGATILYLKPGALTASRVDEIAGRLKRPARTARCCSTARLAGGDPRTVCGWPTFL